VQPRDKRIQLFRERMVKFDSKTQTELGELEQKMQGMQVSLGKLQGQLELRKASGRSGVEANKDNLAGSNNGVLVKCEDSNCTGDYLSIVNLNLKVQTPSSSSSSSSSGGSGGGSYRGYFNCGNNKCDTGETEKTCPKDCAKIIDNSTNTVISLSLPGTNNLDEIKNENTNTQENKQSNSGFWNSLGIVKTIIAVIFIVGIAIAFVAVSMNRRRSREISKF